MSIFTRKIRLPTSHAEFDILVDKVTRKFKITDLHHAAAIISVAIRHLPNDVAHTTLDYLGHSVLKNLANFVAHQKGETLRHESQITQLKDMLTADPGNTQARDELQKAANDGSELAKTTLASLELADNPIIAG